MHGDADEEPLEKRAADCCSFLIPHMILDAHHEDNVVSSALSVKNGLSTARLTRTLR